ncbi:MAG: GNAT family N-acetyltransferase [Bacteroidales bacterium]|nr:GNAT family N-acetyltransferase [Bacteroidales bacterium]
MKTIIPKVDRILLDQELTSDKFLSDTNNGGNEIFVFTAHDSPHLMREVARLREITFRDAGGGTGNKLDIDQYDTAEKPFQQLIVWNPNDKEIVGGYRFIHGRNIPVKDGVALSATSHLFKFSKQFIKEYLPYSLELGRSFVQPNYQPTFNLKKGMYSLDNLWDGLGAMVVESPDIKYLFGKMTMYTDYNPMARDILLYFMYQFFPDRQNLLIPMEQLELKVTDAEMEALFTGTTFEENYRILIKALRAKKENIPPLFNAYMNLSPSMRTFGTAVNDEFGYVEETGMMITIDDVYEKKKKRYVQSYISKISRNIKSIRRFGYER